MRNLETEKIFALLLCLFLTVAAKDATVTFRVTSGYVPDSMSIYIAGGHPQLGNWHPGKTVLERRDGNTWELSLQFPPGTDLMYKFTLGSWETEALNADGTVPGNYLLTVNQDTAIHITINAWKNADFRPPGQITGTVAYHRQLTGPNVKPRDIVVWLPPGYQKAAQDRRYPVLYMHDGQNIVDPATSFAGVDWQVDETADSLIRAGEMQAIIIVGIYNTPDRSAEYSDTPTGHAYMDFIKDTVKPLIDSTYRTLPEREHTASMGASMGGLISFLLAWYHPEVFSQAACLSPAFIYRNYNSVNLVEQYNGPGKDIRVYIDNGGLGVEDTLQYGCDRMLNALQQKGFQLEGNLEWFLDETGEHNESAWANRAWRPLLFMFRKEP